MQRAFINTLSSIVEDKANVLLLTADNGSDYDLVFQKLYPGRFLNCGIAEENMMAVAAGMTIAGYIPFVESNGAFLAYRAYEFIRDDVCLQNTNVKIAAFGCGLSIGRLGPTHHATEDIAALRVLPNLVILSPATPNEASACTKLAVAHEGPVYLRLGMSGEKEYFEQAPSLQIGGSIKLRDGCDAAIFVTGSILEEVLAAAEQLCTADIECAVYDLYSVKPIDRNCIIRAMESCPVAVTVEEHSIFGGIGGAVAEVLAEVGFGKPLLRIGLHDCFASGYGVLSDIREKNGLDANSITQAIFGFLKQRKEILCQR